MNEKDIRNAITTARQYTKWKRKQEQSFKLDYEVMKDMVETAGEFDGHAKTLNSGLTPDQLAAEERLR